MRPTSEGTLSFLRSRWRDDSQLLTSRNVIEAISFVVSPRRMNAQRRLSFVVREGLMASSLR